MQSKLNYVSLSTTVDYFSNISSSALHSFSPSSHLFCNLGGRQLAIARNKQLKNAYLLQSLVHWIMPQTALIMSSLLFPSAGQSSKNNNKHKRLLKALEESASKNCHFMCVYGLWRSSYLNLLR